MDQDVTVYPLTAAKRDLIAYMNAGTLAAGLQELQEEAGAASATDKTPKGTLPSTPASVTATSGPSMITVLWDQVAGAASYNVYSSPASGVTIANGKKTSVGTNLYTDNNPAVGVQTYYVVTAVNSAGESPISNQVSATPGSPNRVGNAIDPPTNLVIFPGDSQVKLSWDTPPGAISFKVYRQTSPHVTATVIHWERLPLIP